MKDSKKENLSPEDEAGRLVGLHGLSARSVAADRLERAHQLGLTDVVDHWYRVYRLLSESAGRPAKAPPLRNWPSKQNAATSTYRQHQSVQGDVAQLRRLSRMSIQS